MSDDYIYGADIEQWAAYKHDSDVPINFNTIEDGKPLPYESNTISIISVFHVLHHVKSLNNLLSEIYRVLKPGGIFCIREHDAVNNSEYMLLDIEHMLWNSVNRDFVETYYENYYSKYYTDRDC